MKKNIEKEIFNNFLSESSEQLSELENAVIELENDPANRESVDIIFRSVHSLKGSCSIFGLSGLKNFAHTMENLMDRIRSRELEPTTDIINVILKGTDHLKAIFGRLYKNKNSKNLTNDEEMFIGEISSILESGESRNGDGAGLHGELMEFLDRPDIKDELVNNDALKELMEIIKDHSPALVKDRRTAASGRLFFEEMDVSRECLAIKSVLEEVDRQNFSENHSKVVFSNLDSLIDKHEEIGVSEPLELLNVLKEDLELVYQEGTGFDDVLSQITAEAIGKYEAMLTSVRPEQESEAAQTVSSAQPDGVRSVQIKIDQTKLDMAVSTAGEMVAISEFFNYLQTQIAGGKVKENLKYLKDAITALQVYSDTLSRELYDIRKVPIQEAMQTLPRLVRDLQLSVGKKVKLKMLGVETPIDKALVPKLETVFVHMIRNSIDHGIETPQERKAAGKPEEGALLVSAHIKEANMIITISDDGKGVDPEKVRQKLILSGRLRPEEIESLSESELIDQIFAPGFSMSEKVTETSGRGVGMDVVNSYLQEMGGTVAVENRPEKGLSITLSIPLTDTTLVKKGLAVTVGSSVFLIPIEMILESFRLGNNEISTVEGKAEVVSRRGDIITLIRLHELFSIKNAVIDPKKAIMAMVQYKKRKVCFMVDAVIGQRQIIYKRLTVKTTRQPTPFEGVSVYDGSKLAMILDVQGVIDQVQH